MMEDQTMTLCSRRTFLQGAAASALAATGTASAAARERVRHAVIGLGSQGRRHARAFAAQADCELAVICDLDPERLEKAVLELANAPNVRLEEDFRRILDDGTIDSLSIVTPDHWHTPMAIMALKAGKHVYIEKPCSHNVHEGVVLARVARDSGKCVQHGTQSRSGQGIIDAVAFMRDGGIGKVRAAKAINHQLRKPIGRAPEQDPPAGVDYDLWLGPAPVRPFTHNRWHYNWHWHWDYGTGDMGNDGVHQVDVARWGLGVGLPNAVSASGGQLFYDDDHETPDTQVVTFEYDDCYLIYEMRLWTDYPMEGHDNGNIFYGDKGTVEVGRSGSFVTLIGEAPQRIGGTNDFEANVRNYLDCVKAADPSMLNSPIAEGALSAALCHYGNIATRTQERLRIDLETLQTNSGAANALLTREYREPYALPELV
jgi:predicted dehydrogenase